MGELSWIRFVLAFGFVLGLLGLFALALRKWGNKLMLTAPPAASPRLQVVEMRALGPRHRLVLIKRDSVEHLLLIGPESQIVVEQGIETTHAS